MNDTGTHMAAMSAALRMLLASHPLRKPGDLLVAASDGVSPGVANMMMSHALEGRSVILVLFDVDEDLALMSRVMVVDGSTTKGQISVGGGKFVQKADGTYAIWSINRDDRYEYRFSQSGRRLVRGAISDDSNRATLEIRGMQALIAKAGTPACLAEAYDASLNQM